MCQYNSHLAPVINDHCQICFTVFVEQRSNEKEKILMVTAISDAGTQLTTTVCQPIFLRLTGTDCFLTI